MTEKKALGVAIVGCGQIARTRHAPEYHQDERVTLLGYYDANPENAQLLADQYGGKIYSSMDALLSDCRVQAVSVCSPNFLHAPHSIAAMRAGKDVLCEKPMASTTREAEEIMEVKKQTGRLLMLGHNQRLVRTHIRAKELLASNAIGTVLSIQTNFKHGGPESWSVEKSNTWFFRRSKASFGVLGDLGSHKIDLVRYLLGEEIEEVFTSLMTLDKRAEDGKLIDLEDNAICIFRMRSGIPGILNVSWTDYGLEDNSTVIYGTAGTMRIFASENGDIVIDLRDGTSARHQVGAISTNANQLSSGVLRAFIDAVVEGKEPPVTGLDGRNTLACLEAARRSQESGGWVKVHYNS